MAEQKTLEMGACFLKELKPQEVHINVSSKGIINSLYARRSRNKVVNSCQRSLCELKCGLSIYRQRITAYEMKILHDYAKHGIKETQVVPINKEIVKSKV